ncbi:hypothetical protein AVEN_123774-1 [Araneus ventricosus]|uniref:Uncharacterized protein n=1 Tax=Araneus ventricosus TaxID=182803 RepID=A0A4Y2BMW8_ARAVE|nr:hypothetical protein AVEN_123774-1 [Araneus ventricosus]
MSSEAFTHVDSKLEYVFCRGKTTFRSKLNSPLRPEPIREQIGKKNIYPQRRNSKQSFKRSLKKRGLKGLTSLVVEWKETALKSDLSDYV